jgi:3',5'-cyclic AMP phosphodiesterase CpdA
VDETVDVEDPPPRQPWEEPPAAAWSSQLSGVGLETLWLVGSVGVALGVFRLAAFARRYGAESTTTLHHAFAVALWLAACLLTAGVVAYFWKRFGGFAMVGAMLTDYGRVARLGGRPPVWLDAPPERALRIAQLSDLHVTEGLRVRMVEKAVPGGNRYLPLLLDDEALLSSHVVLITGDVTDRGTAVAWRHFLDAVDERGIEDRIIMVPGNHDLGMVDPLDGHRERSHVLLRADRFGIVHLANLLKFCEAFAETGGGRRGFVLGEDGPVPFEDAWRAAERAVRPLVAALPTTPVPPLRLKTLLTDRALLDSYEDRIEAARERLLGLFPVAIPLDGFAADRDAVVFVLNSCAISRHPATNALGRVGRAQYRRLDRLARFFAQKLKLVALHHHVVRRSEERGRSFWTRVMAKFTVLGDARPLVRFCRREGVRAVLNGHRHLSYQLRLPNGTVLLAAPSSTLGDELAEDPRPRFERYDVAPEARSPSVGIYRKVVRPAITSREPSEPAAPPDRPAGSEPAPRS